MWTSFALEDSWRAQLNAVARAEGWSTDERVSELALSLKDLSRAYNDEARARDERNPRHLAARLHFSFVRDVPKATLALREVMAAPDLFARDSLRMLDLGAGLGAMSVGALRALERVGFLAEVDVTLVDEDARALGVASALLRSGTRASRVTEIVQSVDPFSKGTFDLILIGQAISEMHRELPSEERAGVHAKWISELARACLAEKGFLVLVEPALRERTRHLHRIRDQLLAAGELAVFAPCLHSDGCPALRSPDDWCHEDLPVNLPAWLVPLARAAGLRYEGLTFSYLVLRHREASRFVDQLGGEPPIRLVSNPLRSKGKLEFRACGAFRDGSGDVRGEIVRLRRLNRDRVKGEMLDDVGRGAILRLNPGDLLRAPRVRADAHMEDLTPKFERCDLERKGRS